MTTPVDEDPKNDSVKKDFRALWHPFTQMQEWFGDEPLVIESGDGNDLIDDQGRRYLDGVSSLWCNVHGHRHPKINAAIRDQLDRIAHTTMLGLTHPGAADLAERLVAMTPKGLTRVFYSDAGATAVEIALKQAFQYFGLRGETQRNRFVSLAEAYHGDTIGAMSVGYSEAFHRHHRPLLFDTIRTTPPHVFRWERGLDAKAALRVAIDEARRTFEAHGAEIAALIVEPLVQGAAGIWPHPPEYLAELARLTKEAGALLICDEVATGFGRTGTMFACEQAGVEPDLMCLGKGLTGGYLPLAATLATEAIFEGFLAPFEELSTFFHGHTFTGNPLCCAAALASLDVFDEEKTMEHVGEIIPHLHKRLEKDVGSLPSVGDLRRQGLMIGIELVQDRETRAHFESAARVGYRACLAARKHDVIIRSLGDTVVLMPPLSITLEEVDRLVDATVAGIREVTES
ncbi:MAG: adenosylmethionine--8-amino-7-oxononanoate transaminase [Candidatus Binatia bacterium]|nr:adenosylmethionine--8-amino-7-oxononanoate transaminase [Candidatus Binatia bacterium]